MLARTRPARAGQTLAPRRDSRQHRALLAMESSGSDSASLTDLLRCREPYVCDRSDFVANVLRPLIERGLVRHHGHERYAITEAGRDMLVTIEPERMALMKPESPTGIPVRHAFRADPSAVAEPGVDTRLMTGCGRRVTLGTGDARPPVDRHGAAQAQQHPSRRGDRLYYADGRVTTIAGDPVAEAAPGRASLPAHEYMRSWSERDREARR